MTSSRVSPRRFQEEVWAIPPAIVLGASAALFVNGYWLIDLLPIESRQIVLLTVLAAVAAAAGYYFLLGWLRRQWAGLAARNRIALGIGGLLVGSFALFGGTPQWLESGRHISFLLPRHGLRVSAASSGAANGVALTWFTASVGDISFDTLGGSGWVRQGDEMVVSQPAGNALTWSGVTGEQIEMVFSASSPGANVAVSWDGHEDILTLSRGKTTYDHEFAVPFYASFDLVVGLGALNFVVLAGALLLALRQKHSRWQPGMEQSTFGVGGSLDRRDLVAIVAALAVALLLRVFNLAATYPAVDEYYHLIAAQQLLRGAAAGSVYPRGLLLVTIPVSFALSIFGHQIWAARLVGVLFNTLAIIPLYLLTRKINRPIARLSCGLFAISPWIITFARVAREYAVYPFYFYWIIYAMVLLVEAVPAGFVLVRDWKQISRAKAIVLVALLCVPPWFGLVTDWLSTFRTILIAYVVLGVVLLARFEWRDRRNWPILGALLVAVAFAARAWYLEQASKLLTWPRINAVPLQYFLPNPPQQWYFDRVAVLLALAVLAGAAYSYIIRKKTFIAAFIYLLLVAYLAVFTFLSKTFFHTRHLLTTELWFVVATAIGIYSGWMMIRALVPVGSRGLHVALALLLALALTNPSQILLPSTSTNPDMPISEDYLHDMSKVQEFMLGHAQAHDVLISTVYGLYASWADEPKFTAQYRINSATPKEDLLQIVESNPSGWIVVDKIRLDLSPLAAKDFSGLDQIEYIGMFDDEYVWRWQRASGWAPARVGIEWHP